MPKPSIAILLPDLRGGGAERVNLDLAKEFARQGHEVEFVLKQARGELLEEAQAAFPVVSLDTPRVRQVPLALARYLRRRRPDALLAAMWPLTVVAPLAQRLSGHECRVVVSEHGMLSGEYRDWGLPHRLLLRASCALGYRMGDARIGVSQGVAQDMASLGGMSRDNFSVIHNPVPSRPVPTSVCLRNAEALWGVPSGRRIVSVGRLKSVKNFPLLLHAFAGLQLPDARLMVVGSGEKEDELRCLAKELDIAERVVFAGFHPDPSPFYMTADLFVLTSDYEGFGNVIVEALACGTTVVCTDCPSGPAEILDNGRYGRLVPVGDVPALSAAMSDALARPDDPDVCRARAGEFSAEKSAAAYLSCMFGHG